MHLLAVLQELCFHIITLQIYVAILNKVGHCVVHQVQSSKFKVLYHQTAMEGVTHTHSIDVSDPYVSMKYARVLPVTHVQQYTAIQNFVGRKYVMK